MREGASAARRRVVAAVLAAVAVGAIGVAAWGLTLLAAPETPEVDPQPSVEPGGELLGSFERALGVAGGVAVSGWAIDPDTTDPVYVRLLLDFETTSVFAGDERPDLAREFPEHGGAHGFAAVLATSPGPHTVCATALNAGPGRDLVLGCYDVTVPAGSLGPGQLVGGFPDAASTGVPAGLELVTYVGDIVVTEDGTSLEGLDIHGVVVVRADDVVIRNCRIRGRPADRVMGLVSNEAGGRNLLIQDTEIAPDEASANLYGVRGWGFTLERVNIHNVVDSAHIYGPNVTITDSWLHDNVHFENDPNFGGTPTHDDGIQIQEGRSIRITGSRI